MINDRAELHKKIEKKIKRMFASILNQIETNYDTELVNNPQKWNAVRHNIIVITYTTINNIKNELDSYDIDRINKNRYTLIPDPINYGDIEELGGKNGS